MPRMRPAIPSARNSSSLSVPSPTPENSIGAPVTSFTLSAAPPRASPSSFVSTTPVMPSRSLNDAAVFTASWPIIASIDEEDILGLGDALDVAELLHQRLVDREAARRVVHDDVAAEPLRFFVRGPADVERRRARDVEHRHVDLLAEDLELLDRRGALHVGGDEQRLLAFFRQESSELRARRRLARALEPDHHDPRALALLREADGVALVVHHADELVVADLHELVARGHAHLLARVLHGGLHGAPDGLLLDPGEEALHDAELDVRLQQREPDLAERRLDILLVQVGQPGEPVLSFAEPLFERVEHGAPLLAQAVFAVEAWSPERQESRQLVEARVKLRLPVVPSSSAVIVAVLPWTQ